MVYIQKVDRFRCVICSSFLANLLDHDGDDVHAMLISKYMGIHSTPHTTAYFVV